MYHKNLKLAEYRYIQYRYTQYIINSDNVIHGIMFKVLVFPTYQTLNVRCDYISTLLRPTMC